MNFFFSVFSHEFLILFIFTFGISRYSLEKSEIKREKRQNKTIKLFKTNDILLTQYVKILQPF